MNDNSIIILNPINPIYHENKIYVSNATPILEPQHFASAFEMNERENNEKFNLKDCFVCLFGICCFSIVCFAFFLFMGGAILFL
jgi:hypothetical protein